MSKKIVMAVTGASGSIYARRLLEGLSGAGAEIDLMISPLAMEVARVELGESRQIVADDMEAERLDYHQYEDMASPVASGSYPTDGMVICPCSCHTLGSIAAGLADTLATRAAHVHLKERRPLVLCVREMPLSRIDLRNMLCISEAGGIICPASPVLYGDPKTIDDLVDSVVGRLLDLLGIANDMAVRWTGPDGPTNLGLDIDA